MHPVQTFIVEDSALIRESLTATLEELAGVHVLGFAADESTATAWLAQSGHHAELLIIDIFLKSGSGLGMLRAARALTPGTRLVVLSNYATADMRRRCMELGADVVFDKSSDIEALIEYCAALAAEPSRQPQ